MQIENQITFINLNPILAPQKVLKKEFTSDDLHLNGTAYKLWTEQIKNIFKGFLWIFISTFFKIVFFMTPFLF